MRDVAWFSRFMMQREARTLTEERFSHPVPDATAIGPEDIPPEFFGLTSYSDATAKVTRREAVQVPAVKRGRDLIAGTLGTIPVDLFDQGGTSREDFADLLRQPERGIPRTVTYAKTVEDMLYDGVAWWLVTEYGWHGYPTWVVRLDSGVDVVKQARQYTTKNGHHGSATRYAEDFDLIRFDSPNDPLLVAGARAIRTHIALDASVNLYARANQPLDYFTPSELIDPDQAALDAALDAWEEARRTRATGYVPAALKYNVAGWSPEQLQLAAQRDHAAKELATLMGLQAERVNVSTTSRTYANIQQDRQEFVDFTLNSYALALSERLSMNDVTPRGMVAQWRWAEFLRTDDATRMGIAVSGKQGGVLSTEESRTYFDASLPIMVPDKPDPAQEPPQPAPAPTTETETVNVR